MSIIFYWFDNWVEEETAPPVFVTPPVVVVFSRAVADADLGLVADVVVENYSANVEDLGHRCDVFVSQTSGRRFFSSSPRTIVAAESSSEIFEGSHADVLFSDDQLNTAISGAHYAEVT